jgi:hypothetical protein
MKDYEKFELLLQQYSYQELTAEDKQLVQQFVSTEEEYESLRVADQSLHSFFGKKMEISPSPKIWHRIKGSRTGPPVQRYYWINKPLPVYATLLLLLGVGSLCWIIGSRYPMTDKVSVMETKLQVDTVFIASKPDTVVRERVIYLERPSQVAPVRTTSNKDLQDHPVTKGINMKEKEELENLLVSGSR